jgi:DNA-damage-inducible protein J
MMQEGERICSEELIIYEQRKCLTSAIHSHIITTKGWFGMARTSSVFARIEPELKEQAEGILAQLGIPMSNAIGLFLRQIVLQRGLPFDMKLPREKPLAVGSLTKEQLDAELEKGYADYLAGKTVSAESVAEIMHRLYGV